MEPSENRIINQIDELVTELYGKLVDRGVPEKQAWAEVETAVSEIIRSTKRMIERGQL